MGKVKIIPIETAKTIPIITGCNLVALLIISPKYFIKRLISGEIKIPTKQPTIIVQAGSKIMSNFVFPERSEEHTSELQSRQYLVCRLLLEKKKTISLILLLLTLLIASYRTS